jgi:hypothetical protein
LDGNNGNDRGNFLNMDGDDFLNLDLDFGNGNGSSSRLLLSENGILMLFGGFMTRAVALVISTSTGPFASTSGDRAHGHRASRRLR